MDSLLPSLPKKSHRRWIILLFFLLGFVLYGHTLNFPFVRWDDGLLIYENEAIRGLNLQNLKTIFSTYDPELYIPLTLLSYQIDYLIGGTNSSIYHFTNLLLHICNSLLVAWIVFAFLRKRMLSLFLGLVFLLHPLNTEAVIWASARKDLLSALFLFSTVLTYLYYIHTKNTKLLHASIALYILGLLSKVTLVTIPLLLLLIDWREGRLWKGSQLREKIPYLFASAAFAFIAVFGKTAVLGSSTVSEKVFISFRSIAFYLQKFLLPTKLSVLYPFTEKITLQNTSILVSAIAVTVVAALVLASLRRSKNYLFGFGWFALLVGPTLLNFSKGSFMYFASDRYVYGAMVGLLLIVGWSTIRFQKHWQTYKLTVIACAVLCILGFGSIMQSRTWRDTETLFLNTIKYYPNTAVAYNNLANVLSLRYRIEGKTEDAIAAYKDALRILDTLGRPPVGGYASKSKVLSNLASAYRQKGDMTRAKDTYDEALREDPGNPHALVGLGIVSGLLGNRRNAELYYTAALQSAPNLITPRVNLGSLYVQLGRTEEAIEILEEATELNPFYPQAHYNLGVAYRKLSRNREALEAYQAAVDLESSFIAARINLGILLAERNKREEAIAEFESVLRYDPQNARALSALQQLKGR